MIGLLANRNVIVGIALLVIVTIIGGYIFVLKSRVDILTEQNKALGTELSVSKASVVSLRSSIDEQNTAIEQLKTAADARTMAFLDEIAKAKSTSDTYRKQANEIIKRTSPQNVSKCDAANQLINEEMKK